MATVLIGNWVGESDSDQAKRVLSGEDPFDEATMIGDEEPPELAEAHFLAIRLPSPSSKLGTTSVQLITHTSAKRPRAPDCPGRGDEPHAQ